MITRAACRIRATLYRLLGNPVLTAMMVCSLVFAVAALIAGVKVWRVSSACTIAQMSAPLNVGQMVTDVAGGSELLAMGVRQATHGDSALAHKDATGACPCAASRGWHWQRI